MEEETTTQPTVFFEMQAIALYGAVVIPAESSFLQTPVPKFTLCSSRPKQRHPVIDSGGFSLLG
ncbi:MAG TPA: hypothetical protein PK014_10235 [Thermoanaerobaculia bacterium]|nr:hypothetical protein [Thermoanaerobaculia bacterium]HUM30497.1 hypothetical protein [Thermoanaerobaculia bacterium]HXK68636.1 hypothetical protein [Thermoanaerobaculia bacterium]